MAKSDITPALVSALVATQFPQWAGLPIRPVDLDGWDNTSFRLGDEMLARLPSAERYAAQVAKQQEWLPRLAERLPLPIPRPLGRGLPGPGYPLAWSIYAWLPGEPVSIVSITDTVQLARDLGAFLSALYAIDPAGGPEPGPHCFFRGGPVATYDRETRTALAALRDVVDVDAAERTWHAAIAAPDVARGVWVHGDVAPSNLLVVDGRLSAVIDFGCSAVGDPACDLVMAWTFFDGESGRAFREAVALDDATWTRARGWALWKAAIALARERAAAGGHATVQRWGWRFSAREVSEAILAEANHAASS